MSGDYVGWTPPPGVGVVEPPVHPATVVDVIYSDGGSAVDCGTLAGDLNWSAVGDGPSIVAYAVVQEYKPAPGPREWWLNVQLPYATTVVLHDTYEAADKGRRTSDGKIARGFAAEPIHVREVPPSGREVVAWAVMSDDGLLTSSRRDVADYLVEKFGGTVVRLSGVMPNG